MKTLDIGKTNPEQVFYFIPTEESATHFAKIKQAYVLIERDTESQIPHSVKLTNLEGYEARNIYPQEHQTPDKTFITSIIPMAELKKTISREKQKPFILPISEEKGVYYAADALICEIHHMLSYNNGKFEEITLSAPFEATQHSEKVIDLRTWLELFPEDIVRYGEFAKAILKENDQGRE